MQRTDDDCKTTPNPPPPPNEDMIDPKATTNAGEQREKKGPEKTVESIERDTPGQAAG